MNSVQTLQWRLHLFLGSVIEVLPFTCYIYCKNAWTCCKNRHSTVSVFFHIHLVLFLLPCESIGIERVFLGCVWGVGRGDWEFEWRQQRGRICPLRTLWMYTSGPGEAALGASRLLNTPILGVAGARQMISIIWAEGIHTYGNVVVRSGCSGWQLDCHICVRGLGFCHVSDFYYPLLFTILFSYLSFLSFTFSFIFFCSL